MRISGLAKLLAAVKLACKVAQLFGQPIRAFVPTGNRAAYDVALANIIAACAVIENINYEDDDPATNLPAVG